MKCMQSASNYFMVNTACLLGSLKVISNLEFDLEEFTTILD
jgi:hypothetical protein